MKAAAQKSSHSTDAAILSHGRSAAGRSQDESGAGSQPGYGAVLHGFFKVFSGEVLSKGISAITIMLLIANLAPDELAIFTFVTALINVFAATISATVTRVYIIERLDRADAAGAVEHFLTAIGLGCLVLAVGAAPLVWLKHWECALALIVVLATCWSDLSKAYFQRQLRFGMLSAVECLRTGTILAGILTLLFLAPAHFVAGAILLLQAGTMLLLTLLVFARRLRWRKLVALRPALALLRSILLSERRWITGYFVLLAVQMNLSVFLLEYFVTPHELAAFGSANRYYALLLLALVAAHVVLMPAIQHAQSAQEIEVLIAQHNRLVPLFALGALAVAVLANWFMPWVDRGKYPEAIIAFQILSASAVLSFLFSPHVNLLFRENDTRFLFWITVVSLPVALMVHAACIAFFRVWGAALSTLLVAGALNAIQFLRARSWRLTLARDSS